MSTKYKLVVVVRDDLNLSAGKMAVQVAHASLACSMKARGVRDRWFQRWYQEGQRKIVLKAADLQELKQLAAVADGLGLVTALVQDAGLTEIPPGTITCLGMGPAPERVLDEVTGHLKLM
jgi:PTH2 family peptidyl-tRNA hydrolase